MRALNTNRAIKNGSWIALVLLGCCACSSETSNSLNQPDTLAMSQQTANFVRAYQTRQLNRAATDDVPLQVSVRIGASTDVNVCQTGELYGPYTVTNGILAGTQTASASSPTLRLTNMGDLSVCLIITSPIDATLDLSADNLAMDTTECTTTAADISGFWEGPFSCTDSCSGIIDGFVALTILQDGYSATYTDSEASYKGTVCGKVFEYSGSGPGYTESGTFVLNNDGSGSKMSSYVTSNGSCSGTCSDPMLQHF